jgi:hypothetical protein
VASVTTPEGEPVERIELAALDPAKVGNALMRIGMVSCQLGHENVYGTVNPYLLSDPGDFDAETQFVIDLLHKRPSDVIPPGEVTAYLRGSVAPWKPEGI